MNKLYTLFAAAMLTAASASATTWGVVGTFNDWDNDVEMEQVSDGIWQVEMESLSGEFKLRADHDWMLNYGANARVTETVMLNVVQGGSNINIPGTAYDVRLVLDEIAETLYIYGTFDNGGVPDTWSVVGEFCGWNIGDGIQMNHDGKGIYTVALRDFRGQFKFVKNNDWEGNLGYNYSLSGEGVYALNVNGGNLELPEGSYVYLTLDPDLKSLRIEAIPNYGWSVIGAFNDWSGDVDMERLDNGNYVVTMYDFEGYFKFRYDHDWNVNLGGDYYLGFGNNYQLYYNDMNLYMPGPASVTFTLMPDNNLYVSEASVVVSGIEAQEGVEYFNLSGMKVSDPRGGIFIRVSGGKTSKVAVR